MIRPADNPFRVERIESLPFEPVGDTWPALLERLASLHYRAAIVGPHGSGKTTLLDQLRSPIESLGYRTQRVWMNADTTARPRCPSGLGQRDIILFDGADHLPRWAWWRFRTAARSAGGLIVTSHHPGLLPTLIETRTTPELLDSLIRRLARCGPGAGDCRELLERHGGNIRGALRELYDRDAGYTPPHD